MGVRATMILAASLKIVMTWIYNYFNIRKKKTNKKDWARIVRANKMFATYLFIFVSYSNAEWKHRPLCILSAY